MTIQINYKTNNLNKASSNLVLFVNEKFNIVGLKKYISRQTKIPIDEIERRSERKQKALTYASNWLCLALIAREQGLEMEQIVSSLSS